MGLAESGRPPSHTSTPIKSMDTSLPASPMRHPMHATFAHNLIPTCQLSSALVVFLLVACGQCSFLSRSSRTKPRRRARVPSSSNQRSPTPWVAANLQKQMKSNLFDFDRPSKSDASVLTPKTQADDPSRSSKMLFV